ALHAAAAQQAHPRLGVTVTAGRFPHDQDTEPALLKVGEQPLPTRAAFTGEPARRRDVRVHLGEIPALGFADTAASGFLLVDAALFALRLPRVDGCQPGGYSAHVRIVREDSSEHRCPTTSPWQLPRW